jgi:putative hydrolase of the HAD superfamily
MSTIRWVLFDLGGVLLEVVQSRTFQCLEPLTGLAAQEIERRITSTTFFNELFIANEFTPAEVAVRLHDVLGVKLLERDVVTALNAELGAEISTTVDLLPALQRRTQIGCLSNTNSIHWDKLLASYSFMRSFDRRFASQLLGCAKPGQEIYEKVSGLLGVSPREILFFDDKSANVEAAQRVGWHARLYTNHERLVSDLREYQLV